MSYYLSPIQKIAGFSFPKSGRFIARVTNASTVYGYYLFDGSPGSWTADPTSQTVGWVDWKGVSQDDVLTWQGPESRYWFPSNAPGYSPWIWRDGGQWAQVPFGKVIGCAVMEYSGARYLNAFALDTSSATTWFLLQRKEAELYENHGMYNASTNPLGWKVIYSETISDANNPGTPSTIFAFNASGTECQGISGYPTYGSVYNQARWGWRTKFMITGETVTMERGSATGQWDVSVHDTHSESHAVNLTYGVLTNNAGQCNMSSECTGPILEPCGDCSEARLEYDWTGSGQSVELTKTATEVQPCVVAVDYIGDAEICAYLEYIGVDYPEVTDTWSRHYSQVTTVPACGSSQSQTSTVDETFSRSLSGAQGTTNWRIRFGEISLVLEGATLGTVDSTRTHINSDASSSVRVVHAEYRESPSRTLICADMRYGHVAYKSYNYMQSISADYSGSDLTIKNIPAAISTTERYSQEIILFGGAPLTMWEHVTSSEDPNGSIFSDSNIGPELGAPSYTSVPCSPYSYDNSYSEVVTADAAAWGEHLFEKVVIKTGGLPNYSIATDVAGNVFASFLVWEEEQGVPPYAGIRWNYLTGGDPVALTGIAGPGEKFYPVATF